MNPNEFGKKLGIGVRVAGRIAQQRARESSAGHAAGRSANPSVQPGYGPAARDLGKKTHKMTRAAGRGIGGFLRPFGRVGGILWLEVTGFFFGLFAIFFATHIWTTRAGYAGGAEHKQFLTAVALTGVFTYLSVSAFWRARRR